MLAQIRPNRLEVSDRYPMLGLTIRTERSPARVEVAVASHPSLFAAEARTKRTPANFYCSRAAGPQLVARGEAVYLLPPQVLARFVGQERLYVALAAGPEGAGEPLQVAVLPTEGSPYVSLRGLTPRGLGRVRLLPRSRLANRAGAGYGDVPPAALEWAGDAAQPGVETAPAQTSAPVPKNGAVAPPADYDDGFGPIEPARKAEPKPAATETPQPKAAGMSVARTLDFSGLEVSPERARVAPPEVMRLGAAQTVVVEAALAALGGPLFTLLGALRAAARAAGVSIGVGPSAGAGFVAGAGLGAGVIFGPDGGIGLYGAAEFRAGLITSASVTAQVTIVGGGIEQFNGWSLAAAVSGGEAIVGGVRALFSTNGDFMGVSFELGVGVAVVPVDVYVAVQGSVARQVAVAQARAASVVRARPFEAGPDVDVKLRIFIPSPLISGPIGVYGGDGRGFSMDAGTSRGELTARIHLTPGGGVDSITVLDRHWGESTEYAADDALDVPGKPDWWKDKREGASPTRRETLAVTDDNLKIYAGATGTRRNVQATIESASIVSIEAVGALPLSAVAPDIDADISLMLRVSGGNVEAKVIAEHDGFPAYEVYANGRRLYAYDPVAAGNDPTALMAPMDIENQTDWVALPAVAVQAQAVLARARAAMLAADEDSAHGIEGPIPDAPAAAGEQLAYGRTLEGDPEYPQASRFVAAHSGNYRHSASARTIGRVVIHITDGGPNIAGPISWFRNPAARVSAHYIVAQDGEVVQMVRHNDVAWHAGRANGDSIGIEHCANTRGLNPSETQYAASAALVRWLCDNLSIPIDREHILGHSEADTHTTHTGCPNAVWDWDYFMDMVTNAYSRPQAAAAQARPRALDYAFTLNWEDVEPIAQPTDVSCWAAAAAMVYGWKHRISLSPQTVAEIAGRTTATGLDPAQVQQFADEMGLSYEQPMSYSVEGFCRLLENNGPLWVAASVPGLHAIVVTGVYRDGDRTYVRVTDPWDRNAGTPGAPGTYLKTHETGSRYILTWDDFVREYEAAATDYSSVNLQILHSGGTDGRTPHRGQPAGYAQSLADKVRATRATARTRKEALIASPFAAAAAAEEVPQRETGSWLRTSWTLDQYSGFRLPSGEHVDSVPDPVQARELRLDDWPFVPVGEGRQQLPLNVSWRYASGAVGDVRVCAGSPRTDGTGTLDVTAQVSGLPAANGNAGLKVTLRYAFADTGRSVIAVTELTFFGDGTYQRQDRWEQAPQAPMPAQPAPVAA